MHILAVLIFVLTSGTHGTDMPNTTSAPDSSQPIARISFPPGSVASQFGIGATVFSGDGEKLYVHVPAESINIWSVLTYYWPEVMSCLLFLTAIVCCLAMIRITRSKRIIGAAHCRKCNYCLHELTSDRCPECNHPTFRPIKGRPQWLRILPWSGALIAPTLIYVFLWMANVPRIGWLNGYFELWSSDLLELATTYKINWLTNRRNLREEIVEYDARTGKLQRVIFSQPFHAVQGFFRMTQTPDGSGLIIPAAEKDALILIDIESGDVHQRFVCPEIQPGTGQTRWQCLGGFNESGESAYVTILDTVEKKSKLFAWNWKTNQYSMLLDADAYRYFFKNNLSILASRIFFPIPGFADTKFLDVASLAEIYEVNSLIHKQSRPNQLLIRDKTLPSQSVTIPATISWREYQNPVVAPDGKTIFVNDLDSTTTISRFDNNGKELEPLRIPNGVWFDSFYQFDWGGDRLVINGESVNDFYDHIILIFDLRTEKWSCQHYQVPDAWGTKHFVLSPGIRYFALAGSKTSQSEEILIFQLDPSPMSPQDGQVSIP